MPKQVLDAADGAKAADDQWPAFHKSMVHTSPLLADLDADGVLDILVATYDGEIQAVKDTVGRGHAALQVCVRRCCLIR